MHYETFTGFYFKTEKAGLSSLLHLRTVLALQRAASYKITIATAA